MCGPARVAHCRRSADGFTSKIARRTLPRTTVSMRNACRPSFQRPGRFSHIMKAEMLEARFARMGARLRLGELTASGGRRDQPLRLDVRSDDAGEFFDVRLRRAAAVDLEVV